MNIGGMFASGRLASIHRVFLRYCSSDGHIGNRTGPLGWHFRGRSILAATLEELKLRHGMGRAAEDSSRTRLLIAGCSAGGRGASYNIDWIRSVVPAGVEVRGFFDSPLWIDLPAVHQEQTSLRTQCARMAELHSESLHSECVDANPNSRWQCLMGEFLLRHIQTPSMIFAYLSDDWQFWNAHGDEGSGWPSTVDEYAFVASLRNRSELALSALSGSHAVFAPACFDHCIYDWRAYSSVNINGATTQMILEQFFFDDVIAHYVDNCTGFDCCEGYPNLGARTSGTSHWYSPVCLVILMIQSIRLVSWSV